MKQLKEDLKVQMLEGNPPRHIRILTPTIVGWLGKCSFWPMAEAKS